MSEELPAARYRLTEADLEELPNEFLYCLPVMRAANNPDTRILEAILALRDPKYSPSAFCDHESALNVAIEAGLTKNVLQLLQAGADPNGIPVTTMSRWSARYMRLIPFLPPHNYRTREQLMDKIRYPQWGPLGDEEISARRKTRLPFWGGPAADVHPRLVEPVLTALESAVLSQRIDLIDVILEAGADVASWTEQHDAMPEDPTISFLSPSTPLHRAIETGNIDVVRHLLQRGFRADVFPLAATNRCMNPLMFSLAARPSDLAMYDILSASLTADHAHF